MLSITVYAKKNKTQPKKINNLIHPLFLNHSKISVQKSDKKLGSARFNEKF